MLPCLDEMETLEHEMEDAMEEGSNDKDDDKVKAGGGKFISS